MWAYYYQIYMYKPLWNPAQHYAIGNVMNYHDINHPYYLN